MSCRVSHLEHAAKNDWKWLFRQFFKKERKEKKGDKKIQFYIWLRKEKKNNCFKGGGGMEALMTAAVRPPFPSLQGGQ